MYINGSEIMVCPAISRTLVDVISVIDVVNSIRGRVGVHDTFTYGMHIYKDDPLVSNAWAVLPHQFYLN